MFFPIGDDNVKGHSKPILNYLFIIVNVAVFFYEFSLPEAALNQFIFTYGSIPAEITSFQDLYTLFTCIFLHGGWMHLLGNMLFLWVFGDNIESSIGSFRYFIFYVGGGVIASLAHAFLSPGSQVPCVGASGAIAACLGAYLVMYPGSRVRILFILFLTTFRVSAIYFLGFWIIQQLVSGVGTLSTAAAESAGVAYWAHIGGFVFGVIAGFILRGQVKELHQHA
ncbi:MAG TPA: rhomboid family intramembrane serine protease [Chitinophagaceae bacterium]|jgi:membrane associated rhomboid family serine protease|nr:rhomboid family intramembrane serine protease [Chitinophagaceae bacterium]